MISLKRKFKSIIFPPCARRIYFLFIKNITIEKNKGFLKNFFFLLFPVLLILTPSLVKFLLSLIQLSTSLGDQSTEYHFFTRLFYSTYLPYKTCSLRRDIYECGTFNVTNYMGNVYERTKYCYKGVEKSEMCNNMKTEVNNTLYALLDVCGHRKDRCFMFREAKKKFMLFSDDETNENVGVFNDVGEKSGMFANTRQCFIYQSFHRWRDDCFYYPRIEKKDGSYARDVFLNERDELELYKGAASIGRMDDEMMEINVFDSVSSKFVLSSPNEFIHLLMLSRFMKKSMELKEIPNSTFYVLPAMGRISKTVNKVELDKISGENDFLKFVFILENSPIIELIILVFFPLSLSFLFPFYALKIINEKKKKLNDYLKLFGVSIWESEIARFISDYLYYLMFALFSIFVPWVCRVDFFLEVNFFKVFFLFCTWGFVMIAASYFYSHFQTKSFIALSFGFIILFISVAIGSGINFFYESDALPHFIILLYPFFAFMRGLTILLSSYQLDVVPPKEEHYYYILMYLIGEGIVLFFLYIILEYNFVKFLLNFISVKYSNWKRRKEKSRKYVINDENGIDNVLVRILNLSKSFKKKKALKGITFEVFRNECIALLGPNGAGKTTLLRLICGMLVPSSGKALFNCDGKSFVDCNFSRSTVRKMISICPQMDILFDMLTVQQTLSFFTNLRGCKGNVNELINEVKLDDHRNQYVKNLSGGLKRRLSIAISLTGSPKLIFFDEPSANVDPSSRRDIWKIIKKQKKERTVFLATHTMKEAEILCDRIVILSSGELKFSGKIENLKKKFGFGYQLVISSEKKDHNTVDNYLSQNIEYFSTMEKKQKDFNCERITYTIPKNRIEFSKLFSLLDYRIIGNFGIKSWEVNMCSLEEVYYRFFQKKIEFFNDIKELHQVNINEDNNNTRFGVPKVLIE